MSGRPGKETHVRWILKALLALLCGCSTVVSTRPMGEAPLDLTGQAYKWTGTWRAPNGPCTLTIADATTGVLTVTSTKPQGWWRWSNEILRVYLRTAGDWIYASVDCTEGTNACYLWGKVANEESIILWWAPDPDKFKPMVEGGALPGTIGMMIKKKEQSQPVFPILGYTPSGEPVYETGVPGGKSEPFTWALDVPELEMPQSSEDENVARKIANAAGNALPACETERKIPDFSGELITLGDLEPTHYELIAATSNVVMFVWEEPFVLVKESARADLRYLRTATNAGCASRASKPNHPRPGSRTQYRPFGVS